MGTFQHRIGFYASAFAVCVALVALIWVAVAVAVERLRAGVEQEAASTRQSLANILAEREASSARAIDISLVALRDAWLRDPASFDKAVARQEQMLRRERVIQTAVVDAEGALVYSRLPAPPGLNFSDRPYFKAHRDHPGRDGLIVSEPVMGRVTKAWAIQFTRPIVVDGRFAGLVVVAMPPPALEHAYREIDLGPNGVITLARRDGQILARSVDFPGSVRVGLAAAGLPGPSGHIRTRSVVDGIDRFLTYRVIEDYDLVIFVGQSVASVLAPFVVQRDYLYASALGLTALLLCVAILVSLRRRDRARYLAEQERMMFELHDGCIQAVYAVGLGLQRSRAYLRELPQRADALIAQAEADLNLVIHDLRAFIGAEKPPQLSAAQLRAEIERALPQAGHTRFAVDLEPGALEALAAEEATHVLRIIREAAANVARHANASQARIRLAREEGEFRLEIADDGRGMAVGRSRTGLGLAHIEARARKLHGAAEIAVAQDGGTRVSVRFPQRP